MIDAEKQAGKTTLLDLIAGRRSRGQVDGAILFAGAKPTDVVRKRYTGYCEQFDTLVAVLTVRQTLTSVPKSSLDFIFYFLTVCVDVGSFQGETKNF